jgi:hypothetical protein
MDNGRSVRVESVWVAVDHITSAFPRNFIRNGSSVVRGAGQTWWTKWTGQGASYDSQGIATGTVALLLNCTSVPVPNALRTPHYAPYSPNACTTED